MKSGFRYFVLGAGFSKPAGLPLGTELWTEIRKRAESDSYCDMHLSRDLEYYMRFKHECDGIHINEDDIDFEDFLAFLDVEFILGLRGSKTYSRNGNETQIIIKTLIGEILTEKTPSKESLPQQYYDFAESLGNADYILTFNYDTLLERALKEVGVPFRLFPYRDDDSSREEVCILKLHGSIDWFDKSRYIEHEKEYIKEGMNGGPRNPVFGHNSIVTTEPLLENNPSPNDPLINMYRVDDIETLYKNRRYILCHETPCLLAPSYAKIVYTKKLDFFFGFGQSGGWSRGLAIIGYSLPRHDDYIKQALYSIVKNYQEFSWDDELVGKNKTPVLMIDLKSSFQQKEEYKKRYAFVDPAKAKYHFNGFDNEAINLKKI